MAFAVQRLNQPVGVALVLIGLKGSGKSMLVELFGHLFGQHTFITSQMGDVVGRFNDRLETTLLLGLEEAVAPQNKAADGTLCSPRVWGVNRINRLRPRKSPLCSPRVWG